MSISQVNIWIDSLANWVWTTSGSASILILLLLAVQFLFRKRLSARWLYALWCCALIRLCLPGVPASPLSAMNFFTRGATSPAFEEATAGDVGGVPPHVAPAALPEIPVDQVPPVAPRQALVPGPLKVLWLAGAFIYLVIIIRQHRRWEQRLRNEKTVDESCLLQLLEEAKERVGCKASVRLVKTEYVSSPTLFGWEDPTLLLPANLNITESELRLVMMHELMHVKRGDVLINWLAIILQAMHWFNPLVWLGLRQFRAARELACDELVVRRLEPDERKTYGSMLINLVDATFNPSAAPTFVPIISQQKQMHRRITMIANFKPARRKVTAVAASILFVLVCLTFTRAADRPAAAEPVIVQAAAPEPEKSNEAQKGLARLDQILAEYDELVAKKQAELDRMREEFKIVRAEDDGSNFSGESLRKLESARVEAMADSAQIDTLLDQLKRLTRSELKKAILTASPDPSLSTLVEQQSAAEQKLAIVSENFGSTHPEVRTAQKLVATIANQINDRMDGILEGMKAKAAAHAGKLKQIKEEISAAKDSDIEAARRRRPYFQAKRDLENLQLARDRLQLRLLQEKVDAVSGK